VKYFISFLISFFSVSFITPYAIKLSEKYDFVDKPNERKAHKYPASLCGGIVIFIVFFIIYSFFIKKVNTRVVSIFVSSFLIVAVGLVDDWYKSKGKELSALPKSIVQIIAAVIIYNADIVFSGFNNPFANKYVVLPTALQFFFTIAWIFGVTTVINFVDGLDGLAGGIVSISTSTLFIVSLVKNQPESSIIACILIGSVMGFLRYNKPPAKVFLGDSGATFLGFIISIISLEGVFKQATIISIFIPIFALGVPILDNIYVVFKRLIEKKPVYKADRKQIHYRLLSLGFKQNHAVAFLYLISICLGLTSIIIMLIDI